MAGGEGGDATLLALTLDGPIELGVFEEAISSFRQLVDSLTEAVAPSGNVLWVIDYLEAGSAQVVIRGEAPDMSDVRAVVDAWGDLGEAAELTNVSDFPTSVQQDYAGLAALLNGKVETIRMYAGEREAFISEPLGAAPPPVRAAPAALYSLGAVSGRIETLAHRQMRFSLYDTLDDKRIDCWLRAGDEDLVKEAWGRLAIVEGRIRRDPRSGRALSVREITNVVHFDDPNPDAWRRAQGAVNVSERSELPEDTIRRLRDDE